MYVVCLAVSSTSTLRNKIKNYPILRSCYAPNFG
nr:MAG TPA: hypothetical protein [Caudoviricetes sp.]